MAGKHNFAYTNSWLGDSKRSGNSISKSCLFSLFENWRVSHEVLRHSRKASRSAKWLRILIEGPSGSGKTYGTLTGVEMIKILGGKIFVVDTEKGSSNSYTTIIDEP